MTEPADEVVWVFGFPGDGDELIEPPADLGVSVRSRERTIALSGEVVELVAIAMPLAELARDMTVNLFASWLYERYRKRGAKKVTAAQQNSGTSITINGDVYIVADEKQLAKILKRGRG